MKRLAKHSVLIILGVVCVCVFTALLLDGTHIFSQENTEADRPANTGPSLGTLRRIITGEVETINYATLTLNIKQLIDGQSSMYKKATIVVDENTAITRGFGSSDFSSIKVGDKATVEYRNEGGKNIAYSIVIVASEVVKSKGTK